MIQHDQFSYKELLRHYGFCDNYKMADDRNVNVVEKIAIKLLV